MLKVGLAENLVNTRFSPTALPRASYVTAVATGMDSFWLPDHLNSLLPRAVMTPKYVGLQGWYPTSTRISNPGPCSEISLREIA
jgi:phthiodiolone/phenolphthiodiolone dimycocerosates ketoreductase